MRQMGCTPAPFKASRNGEVTWQKIAPNRCAPRLLLLLLRRYARRRDATIAGQVVGGTASTPTSPSASSTGLDSIELLPDGILSGDPLSDPSTTTFSEMSAIFDGYEKELLELSSAIARKAALIPTLTRGEHWNLLSASSRDDAGV